MKQAVMMAMAALLGVSSAEAKQYTDTNSDIVWISTIFNSSHSDEWNILDLGYDKSMEQIDSATATFKLNDALGRSESYTISIDDDAFLSGNSFSTPLLGTITVGATIGIDALLTLNDAGVLSYTIKATRGEFWLAEAKLVADVSARTQPSPIGVPDGGATLALLGFGMLGLLGASRRIA